MFKDLNLNFLLVSILFEKVQRRKRDLWRSVLRTEHAGLVKIKAMDKDTQFYISYLLWYEWCASTRRYKYLHIKLQPPISTSPDVGPFQMSPKLAILWPIKSNYTKATPSLSLLPVSLSSGSWMLLTHWVKTTTHFEWETSYFQYTGVAL